MIATAILQLTSVPHGLGPMFVISGITLFCTYCLLPVDAKSMKAINAIKRR